MSSPSQKLLFVFLCSIRVLISLAHDALAFKDHCRLQRFLLRPQEVMKRYKLREQAGADPQTYALGLKEVWEVSQQSHAIIDNIETVMLLQTLATMSL